jgi:hypothetical protein
MFASTRPDDCKRLHLYHAVDKIVASLIALGATVAITADHGMSDKSAPDGMPNVIYLEDEPQRALRRRRRPCHLPDRGSLRPTSRCPGVIRPCASAEVR